MKKINVYTPAELKEKHPEGYVRALKEWQEVQGESMPPWSEEIMKSLKELIGAIPGVELVDWSIGPYSESTIRLVWDDTEVGGLPDLAGPHAAYWLKKNLYDQFKVKPGEYTPEELKRYRYKVGGRKDCPLTGCAFDEDFIEALDKQIKDGYSLDRSLRSLARTASGLMEAEAEHAQSEEQFLENPNEDYYTESGHWVC